MPLWVLESLEWVGTDPQPRGSMIYVMGPETQILSGETRPEPPTEPKEGMGS